MKKRKDERGQGAHGAEAPAQGSNPECNALNFRSSLGVSFWEKKRSGEIGETDCKLTAGFDKKQ